VSALRGLFPNKNRINERLDFTSAVCLGGSGALLIDEQIEVAGDVGIFYDKAGLILGFDDVSVFKF
jgi:hypothetical protein